MNVTDFIKKWRQAELTERSASQQHFLDLCSLLEHPTPAQADPQGATFTFEKGVRKRGGGDGWADVWKKGFFGWEYKGKHRDLEAAYAQLLQYCEALENPPLLVVCDLDRIVVHTHFNNAPTTVHEIPLAAMADPTHFAILHAVFHEPERLRPERTPDEVTQEAAEHIAAIAQSLRDRGLDPHAVARFLDRIVFCLFAEDIGLLPEGLFSRVLEKAGADPPRFTRLLGQLFEAMAHGGDFGLETIRHFNGDLFMDGPVLTLTEDEIAAVAQAARLDWSAIKPSIFGTLFERGLDPAKRAQLGAHYTSEDDIQTLVQPVVMAPLRREWDATRQTIENLLATGKKQPTGRERKAPTGPRLRKARDEAVVLVNRCLDRLSRVRVLDPACGSGNFLYVTLQMLKDLEKEVVTYAADRDLGGFLPRVMPTQLHGIEINPYAFELAQMTVWIGWLQWTRNNGFGWPADPVLRPMDTFQCKDAILERVAQPPSAVDASHVAQPPSAVEKPRLARPAKPAYQRNLPHLQSEGKTYFVTFRTWKGWTLPEPVRSLVVAHCLHDHGVKLWMHGLVVMPDHVHLVFTPLEDDRGEPFGLSEILSGIKGASAHSINKALGRRGHVWQDESFDHVLRSDESAISKADYVCQNPVRLGLVARAQDYPWLWREWVEGEAPRAAEPQWPHVDFIVGNPPFLGTRFLRRELGDDYVDDLFAVWRDRVPASADLCCYWFEKARAHVEQGQCQRAGLLATQGIRGGANRDVLKRIKDTGDIFFAESDRPWVLDGASVHVSMVAFDDGTDKAKVLDGRAVSTINPNLTSAVDTTQAKGLAANGGIAFMADTKGGAFDIDDTVAVPMLLSPTPSGKPISDVIVPWVNGRDITARRRGMWIIDFGVGMDEAEAAQYEAAFEYVRQHVKPKREKSRSTVKPWWRHERPRPEMRAALGLRHVAQPPPAVEKPPPAVEKPPPAVEKPPPAAQGRPEPEADTAEGGCATQATQTPEASHRFLATPRVTKHRLFVWLSAPTLADAQLIVFARADDCFFGILHSRLHEAWARAQGTQLRERESGFRYTPTTCFETFPFPEPTQEQRAAIAEAARELNEQRERWLNPPEWVREEVLEFPGSADGPWARYVHAPDRRGIGTVRYPRLVPKDDACARKLKKRTLTNLYNARPAWLDHAHRKLDTAVFAAYGWPPDLPEEAVLEKLLALNLARSRGGQ